MDKNIYYRAALKSMIEVEYGGTGYACLSIRDASGGFNEESLWIRELSLFQEYFYPGEAEVGATDGGGWWMNDDNEPRIIALLLMSEIVKDL